MSASELKFQITTSPSYDTRGQTPNYGQHPLVFFFTLKGPKGAVVMELNSSWLLSEAKSWTFPHSGMKRNIQQPYCTEVNLHRFVTQEDMHEDTDQIHDDCGWLDGEACIVERISSSTEAHEWLLCLVEKGDKGIEEKLTLAYNERFASQ